MGNVDLKKCFEDACESDSALEELEAKMKDAGITLNGPVAAVFLAVIMARLLSKGKGEAELKGILTDLVEPVLRTVFAMGYRTRENEYLREMAGSVQ